ncbi:MAG: RDD family protein [Nocardiopsaceae bacterium]|nr:RDD family protein [Nocardiopsaceae bacterium]
MSTPPWQDPQAGYSSGYGPAPGYGPPAVPGGGYSPPEAPLYQLGYPGYPGMPAPRYASWGARLAAYLIDSVILNMIVYACYFGGALLGIGLGYLVDPTMESDASAMVGGGTIMVALIAAFVSPFLYMWLPVAKSGQTLGKRALSIKVVSVDTGLPPGKGRAAARVGVLMGISLVTCGIGVLIDCLWPLWDEQRQSLHDKAARTIVIDK